MKRRTQPLSRVWAAWRMSTDLIAISVLAALANVLAVVPVIDQSPVRAVVGLVFVLFAPGYALISALYPETGTGFRRLRGGGAKGRGRIAPFSTYKCSDGVNGTERIALAFGLSLGLAPLLGILAVIVGVDFTAISTRVPLTIVTLVCAGVAVLRRMQVPEDRRFQISFTRWGTAAYASLTGPSSRTDTALNVALTVAIVFAVGMLVFGVTTPPDGERYTGFYALTENESGELVAGDYPTEFTAGESQPLIFAIDNQEHESTTYTVVVELQRVASAETGTTDDPTVVEEQRLARFQTSVANNGTWQQTYQLRPTITGDPLRVVALLYKSSPPADPSVENAYRDLHFWISVEG